jgi:cation diffusion facilitator family transporter
LKKVKAALLSIVSNSCLVVMKLVAGVMMFSVSVLSEAVHSMMDLIAAILVNYSVRKAIKPPDKEHAYGHGKYENVAGVVEALLIFFVAAIIIYESLMKIIFGSPVEFLEIGIVIMGISTVTNFFVSRYLSKVAEEEDSIALEADSMQLKTDVLTSMSVFLGLIVINFTHLNILDPIIAIVVAGLIVRAAYKLTMESSKGLVDEKLPSEEEMVIKNVLLEHMPEFVEFHSLRTRKGGDQRFIDLHLVMKADTSVEDSHKVADHLEHEIKKRLPRTSVLIHVEPCDWRNCPLSDDNMLIEIEDRSRDKSKDKGKT